MTWSATQLPDLSGRTAIITGANSGIGWHTAKALALHGCRVLLACRDLDRAKTSAERIRAAGPAVDVEIAHLDLAVMNSVREFAESRFEPIDILINNAGVMAPPKRTQTVDGFELQFATNHLGHFVLTGLLLPLLLQAERPRVVTVASVAHREGTDDVVVANAKTYIKGDFATGWRKALHDGWVEGTAFTAKAGGAGKSAVSSFAAPSGVSGLEISFRPDPSLYDGRFANVGWLQELPKQVTNLSWDNAAIMSMGTMADLKLEESDPVKISFNGREWEAQFPKGRGEYTQ